MRLKTETKVGMFVIISLGVFAYMLVHLGVFRLYANKYRSYEVCFNDVSGLTAKSGVKIAGVKVGWIEKITLTSDGMQARVRVMIKARYQLYQDAYAVIRQEGIIGSRYLEMVTGDPNKPIVPPGTCLTQMGRHQASIETLMSQCQDVVENVKAVSCTLNRVFGSSEQAEKLSVAVANLAQASEHIAHFTDRLDTTFADKEQAFRQTMDDCQIIAHQVKEVVPELRTSIAQMTDNFNGVAAKLTKTADTIEVAMDQARDGVASFSSIAKKLDGGQGFLGKLINDEQVYNNIKSVTQSFSENFDRLNKMRVDVDAHGESMMRATEEYCHSNNKGYLNMRLYTMSDWFYLVQLVTSEKGWPDRCYTNEIYVNDKCKIINPEDVVIDNGSVRVAPNINRVAIKRNNARMDVQVGKIYRDWTFRAGLFEHTFGVAVDYALPIDSTILRWSLGLEIFDLYGQNRYWCDRRPHLKFINRLTLFNNLYITFGADDFISKHNKNGFFGAGLCFSDDDLKHVASKIGMFGTD